MDNNSAKQLDSLKFLSHTHRSEFNERRKYEWKILFAVLTFYALTVAAICREDLKIMEVLRTHPDLRWVLGLIVFAMFLLVAILSSLFIRGVHRANDLNKEIAKQTERKIDELGSLGIIPADTLRPLAKWAPFYQILILFLFAVCAGFLVIIRLLGEAGMVQH